MIVYAGMQIFLNLFIYIKRIRFLAFEIYEKTKRQDLKSLSKRKDSVSKGIYQIALLLKRFFPFKLEVKIK